MPYIYKITNTINNKIYIGKTLATVEKRWKQHLSDYQKETENHRPLYSAMKKYGIDNFLIETIEECDVNELSVQERYWIEFYQSFKYGYNATLGGDGKPYIDYELVRITYKELQNITDTAKKLGISRDSVSRILSVLNEQKLSGQEVNRIKNGKPVNQYDINGNYIQTFPSIKNAAISIGAIKSNKDRGAASHIRNACIGKQKTAYGYKWAFSE